MSAPAAERWHLTDADGTNLCGATDEFGGLSDPANIADAERRGLLCPACCDADDRIDNRGCGVDKTCTDCRVTTHEGNPPEDPTLRLCLLHAAAEEMRGALDRARERLLVYADWCDREIVASRGNDLLREIRNGARTDANDAHALLARLDAKGPTA